MKDLFEDWVALNDVPMSWRTRFDNLKRQFEICKTREDAIRLLRAEGFFERYPKLPDYLTGDND